MDLNVNVDNEQFQSSFEKYEKSSEGSDGFNFENLMCAFYALKLFMDENITDFKMTTNDVKGKKFDDILLTVKFQDNTTFEYRLQLKFRKQRPLNNKVLEKYLKEVTTETPIPFFVLFTNSKVNNCDNIVTDSILLQRLEILLTKDKIPTNIIEMIDTDNRKMYVIHGQVNGDELVDKIDDMWASLNLPFDCTNTFKNFISNWYNNRRSFVLTKAEILMNIIAMTMTGQKSERSFDKEDIESFFLTNTERNQLEPVWKEFKKIVKQERKNYILRKKTCVLWRLGLTPLITPLDYIREDEQFISLSKLFNNTRNSLDFFGYSNNESNEQKFPTLDELRNRNYTFGNICRSLKLINNNNVESLRNITVKVFFKQYERENCLIVYNQDSILADTILRQTSSIPQGNIHLEHQEDNTSQKMLETCLKKR